MKKLLILALFTAVTFCAAAQELTVATYNIRNANRGDAERGNGWERRGPWVCRLIEFHGFDIFGSQEVLDGQLHDMLAQLPDYDYIGVGRDDGKTQGEYAPIFYKKERFRLLDDGHFWLSEITDRPNKGWDAALPRICTWGHFLDLQTKRRFWFFNLHMDHIGVQAREESAKLVVAKIREMCKPKEFVILTGDFNVDQNNHIYTTFVSSGILADSYETAGRRYAPNGTFNSFNPSLKTDSRIDHIFVTPSVRVHDYGVLTDTYRTETAASGEEIKSGAFPKEVSQLRCAHAVGPFSGRRASRIPEVASRSVRKTEKALMNDIVRQIGPDVAGPIWRYRFRRNPGYFIIYNWRVGRRQGVRSRRTYFRRPIIFAGLRLGR